MAWLANNACTVNEIVTTYYMCYFLRPLSWFLVSHTPEWKAYVRSLSSDAFGTDVSLTTFLQKRWILQIGKNIDLTVKLTVCWSFPLKLNWVCPKQSYICFLMCCVCLFFPCEPKGKERGKSNLNSGVQYWMFCQCCWEILEPCQFSRAEYTVAVYSMFCCCPFLSVSSWKLRQCSEEICYLFHV